MKRTFLAKRNALLSSRGMSWGVLALVFALFMLLMRLIAPNFFWKMMSPMFTISDALSAESRTFFQGFSDTATLAQSNRKITTENAALSNENQALLEKVANLTALLGTSSQRSGSSIVAGVVARPPESPYDTLVLAAGKKDGVQLGQEAFAQGGVPIGIVSSVLDDFSRVTLFSAAGTVTDGWVGHANVPLVIEGAGAGVMNAMIARTANVAEGDTVFAPGPGMLPIGSVVRVESNSLLPGVTLRIVPAVNLFSLSWVELRATGVVPSMVATSTTP